VKLSTLGAHGRLKNEMLAEKVKRTIAKTISKVFVQSSGEILAERQ
jgi:hypothetical protein